MSEPTENDPLDFLSGNAPELSGPASGSAPKPQNKPSRAPMAPMNKPVINPSTKAPGSLKRPQMPMPGKPQSEQARMPVSNADAALDDLPEIPAREAPVKQADKPKQGTPTVARVFFQAPKQPSKPQEAAKPAETTRLDSVEPDPMPEMPVDEPVIQEVPATPPPLPTPIPVTPVERPEEPPELPLAVEEDIEDEQGFDPEGEDDFEHVEPDEKKTKFRFPAWLIVVLVLVVAIAGFVVVYPIIPNLIDKSGETVPPVADIGVPSVTDSVVTEPVTAEPTTSTVAAVPEPTTEQDVDLFSDNMDSEVPDTGAQAVVEVPEEITQPATSVIPVQMGEFLVPLAGLDFQSNEVGGGSFKQLGTLTDGDHVIVVGVMNGTFDTVVMTMSQRALDAARSRGNNPTLSGPNRLGNAKLTSYLFTVMEGEDANKEVRTYLIVEGSDTNLVLGTQSSADNAGYGLSKFITIASDITSK